MLNNIGLSAAYDVKVTITPKLVHALEGKDGPCGLTMNTIIFLAPGREITDFLGRSFDFLKKYEPPHFEGSVEYADADKVRRSEPFIIDLSFHKDIGYVIPKEIADEVAGIGGTLRDIAGKMKR